MSTLARLPLAALAMLAALLLTSCSDNNDHPVASPLQARVMAVHASPDAPAVDIALPVVWF